MRVITLKQPWATLVAEGIKEYEFRTWQIKYRGEILIHAGKGVDFEALKKYDKLKFEYPNSQIIAKVKIKECIKLNYKTNSIINKKNKLIYGNNKNREGFAWKLELIEKYKNNKKILGKQGIWYIDKDKI